MSPSTDRTESIFAGAVALPVENRADFLERECGQDAILRKHVEALLHAHERSTHMLDRPVPGGPEQTAAYVPDEKPGTVVAGRYKLLENVGEGGMGTVWVAEQTQPVRRKVAVKLIKAGMDSRSVLARFEAERQALALMDHPNIAKVLDGGLTEQGRPYFVMEYVKGVPITEYCDATRLSIHERLQLFMQVCQAVQHAHQKGIIHRDLKPSNILVAPYDDKPVPKIIDFGLAKAMHQSLTERTLHTAHESVLGTPLYMSPEQAQLNNLDVDTRSDIYSLGVLLYELLTGTTPLEKQRFKQAAWDEVRRIIREEEPPKPSTRLSSIKTLASLAAGRQTDTLQLTKQLKGELDWIVMKALEKDRSRRYETANGFAADVNRYLTGEAVTAVPPSASYRLRKFVRKHKGQVIAASLVLLVLLAGIVGTSLGMIAAQKQREIAMVAQHEAAARAEGERKAKLDAEEQAKKARNQAEMAQAVREFLEKDLIAQADPNQAGKTNVQPDVELKLKTALDRAVPQIAERFAGKPLIEASIRRAIGKAYQGRGLHAEAVAQMEKACELYRAQIARVKPEDIEALFDGPIIESTVELMGLYLQHGQKQKAVACIKKLEDQMRPLLGDGLEDRAILASIVTMREIAEGQDPAEAMKKLVENYRIMGGQSPKQVEEMQEVQGPSMGTMEFVKTSTALKKLMDAGKYQEAEQLLSQQIESDRGQNGAYLEIYKLMLTNVYQNLGKYAQAEAALKQLIESYRVKGDHQQMFLTIAALAEVYRLQGKNTEAKVNYETARDGLKKALGEDHGSLGTCHMGLAQILLAEKKYVEAETAIRTALTFYKKTTPGQQHAHFEATSLLGFILAGQKKYVEAEPMLIQGYEGLKQQDQTAPEVKRTMLPAALDRLIQFYTETHKPEEVKKWQAEREKLTKPVK